MTNKSALQKLDHAIKYLKERAAQMPPTNIVGGKILDEEHRGVRDAMRALGVAMCDVVHAMAVPGVVPVRHDRSAER